MKKLDGKVALILAIALVAVSAVGLFLDRYRTVAEYTPGEAEDADLLITEVCTGNRSIVKDSAGNYSDYIEIYNRGKACNLSGFTVSDGKKTSEPFGDLPLAEGEYRVLFLGKANTGFALSSAGGETVVLRNRDRSVAAQVKTVSLLDDQVMAWNGNGYEVTDRATPGFPNTEQGYLAFTVGEPDDAPAVIISELMTSNRTTLPDGAGFLCDLVELQNVSDAPVSLGGYYLSDRKEDRFRQALPSLTLAPGEFAVIFCDKESTDDTLPHVGFGFSVGETVVLTSSAGKYTSLEVRELSDDRSLARKNGEYTESQPSFGYANDENGEEAFRESRIDRNAPLVISEVMLSCDGNVYGGRVCDAVEISNRTSEPINTKGWYLTDGGDLLKYALPERTVQPGECVVVVCDRKGGEWTSGFGLSSGETVLLTGPDFRHGDPVCCMPAGDGRSLNLVLGEDGNGYRTAPVSMGYANGSEGEAAFAGANLPDGLRISEVISSNTKYLRGPYATCCDWVELYNASAEPIDLSGWYLTDDPKEPHRGALPAQTVKPGEYFIVFLSKTEENLLKGYPILPFGLSSGGDRLYLYHGDSVADHVILPALPQDVSYGRPDGKAVFAVLASVTPGQPNGGGAIPSEMPTASTPSGVYNNVSSVEVQLYGEGTIYYTTDCTLPTASSAVYTSPIRLTKTTVIRAVCRAPGKDMSDALDLSYIINENHTLPVATLVTTPENLWDHYTGIYVPGPNPGSEFPYATANFWKQWEKEATVSLFETDGSGFTAPCGIRIFGAYSRALAQKSFSCFFRSGYGMGSLNYPLYGERGLDSYEAFVFRNTGQDFSKARMRDPMLTDMVSAVTDVDVQKNRPVVLYLNGEYWGIYYIREKINENYIAGNRNVSKDEVDLTRANGTTSDAYQELIRYVRSHDLSQKECYDYVCSQVDIDNYIDYIVAEICMCNTDNGNIKFYKTEGGKWRWILYDVDQSTVSYEFNTVAEHLNPNGTGSMDRFSTALINGLLKNPSFRDKFLARFAWQFDHIWNPENFNAYIDRYAELLRPEIERDRLRWDFTVARWEEHLRTLRTFADRRIPYVIKGVQSWFHLSDAEMEKYGLAEASRKYGKQT